MKTIYEWSEKSTKSDLEKVFASMGKFKVRDGMLVVPHNHTSYNCRIEQQIT